MKQSANGAIIAAAVVVLAIVVFAIYHFTLGSGGSGMANQHGAVPKPENSSLQARKAMAQGYAQSEGHGPGVGGGGGNPTAPH